MKNIMGIVVVLTFSAALGGCCFDLSELVDEMAEQEAERLEHEEELRGKCRVVVGEVAPAGPEGVAGSYTVDLRILNEANETISEFEYALRVYDENGDLSGVVPRRTIPLVRPGERMEIVRIEPRHFTGSRKVDRVEVDYYIGGFEVTYESPGEPERTVPAEDTSDIK